MTQKNSSALMHQQIKQIVAETNLSLAMLELMHYYLVQLPKQQQKLRSSQRTSRPPDMRK